MWLSRPWGHHPSGHSDHKRIWGRSKGPIRSSHTRQSFFSGVAHLDLELFCWPAGEESLSCKLNLQESAPSLLAPISCRCQTSQISWRRLSPALLPALQRAEALLEFWLVVFPQISEACTSRTISYRENPPQ